MEKRRESPLYSDAVYGIRKTKTISAALTFSAGDEKRFPKNSGMVAVPSFWVRRRVRRPSTTHARREPRNAFPSPIHVDATPNFHPN